MWYALIRIVITAAILIPLWRIYKKRKKNISKPIFRVSLILLAVLFSIIWYGRFENLFITFSSPEKAFYYTNLETIDVVVEGEESTMIICANNTEQRVTLLPKTNEGWKIKSRFKVKISIVVSDYSISIFSYDNTDYYVIVTEFMEPEIINITDNYGSVFTKHVEQVSTGKSYVTYFSYIEDPHAYELIINGDRIQIKGIRSGAKFLNYD